MNDEDRLLGGEPWLKIPDDTGDQPIATAMPSGNVSQPRMANATAREIQPLPREEGIIPLARRRALAVVDVSDVIAPERFRRVYQSVITRTNGLYRGPILYRGAISITFNTHVTAMMAEELGTLAPSGPTPTTMPSRAQTYRTVPNSNVRSQIRTQSPPTTGRDNVAPQAMPINSQLADRMSDWRRLGTTTGGGGRH